MNKAKAVREVNFQTAPFILQASPIFPPAAV